MPKTLKLILNMFFSLILFLALAIKLANTLSYWRELAEFWKLGEGVPTIWTLFFVFGAYLNILLAAVSVWTRGVLPIVLSAVGGVGAFILYCIELFFVSLYKEFEVDKYIGFDPLISVATYIVAFFVLAVAIADLIIEKNNRNKNRPFSRI